MNLTGFDDTDLKLLLLSGSSIFIDGIEIKPYTMKEIISQMGYANYLSKVQVLSLTVKDFINNISDLELRMEMEVKKNELKPFDFFTEIAGDSMFEPMVDALSILLRTDDILMIEQGVLAINFVKRGFVYFDDDGVLQANSEKIDNAQDNELTYINRDTFDEIVNAISYQNFLKKLTVQAKNYNPADEETQRLIEQMEKNSKRIREIEKREAQENDDETDIADMISAIASKSNTLNKYNIWDLTIYQLYDEYSRLEIIDSYNFSLKAMMAGADNVELKHWSSRTN